MIRSLDDIVWLGCIDDDHLLVISYRDDIMRILSIDDIVLWGCIDDYNIVTISYLDDIMRILISWEYFFS